MVSDACPRLWGMGISIIDDCCKNLLCLFIFDRGSLLQYFGANNRLYWVINKLYWLFSVKINFVAYYFLILIHNFLLYSRQLFKFVTL